MGKFRQLLTESSARKTIVAGYYCFTFILTFCLVCCLMVLSGIEITWMRKRELAALRFFVCSMCALCRCLFALPLDVIGYVL